MIPVEMVPVVGRGRREEFRVETENNKLQTANCKLQTAKKNRCLDSVVGNKGTNNRVRGVDSFVRVVDSRSVFWVCCVSVYENASIFQQLCVPLDSD